MLLCHDPIVMSPKWFCTPPVLHLLMGSRPDYRRNDLLSRGRDIERHPGPKRAFLLRGRNVLLRDVPLLRFALTWPFQNLKNISETETFMGSKDSSAAAEVSWVMLAPSIRACVASGGFGLGHSHLWLEDLVVPIWRAAKVYFARCGVPPAIPA